MKKIFDAQTAAGSTPSEDMPTAGRLFYVLQVKAINGADSLAIQGSLDGEDWTALDLDDLNDQAVPVAAISATGLYRVEITGIKYIRETKTGANGALTAFRHIVNAGF